MVLKMMTLRLGSTCCIARSPLAQSFIDAFSQGSHALWNPKQSSSEYSDCNMAAVSGKGKTSATKSIRPSTGTEDTVSRKAREPLELVPKLPETDVCELESLLTMTREDVVGGDESERTRVPAE
jgi:hypothetical protein